MELRADRFMTITRKRVGAAFVVTLALSTTLVSGGTTPSDGSSPKGSGCVLDDGSSPRVPRDEIEDDGPSPRVSHMRSADDIRESIDYLTKMSGTDREDALGRLRQDNGGRLVVYSTSDDLNRLRGLIPRYQHRLETRRVPWSLAELKRTQDEIRDMVGGEPEIFVGVKETARLVVVGMTLRAETRCRASIENLVESYGDKVAVAVIEPTPELDDTGTPIRDR